MRLSFPFAQDSHNIGGGGGGGGVGETKFPTLNDFYISSWNRSRLIVVNNNLGLPIQLSHVRGSGNRLPSNFPWPRRNWSPLILGGLSQGCLMLLLGRETCVQLLGPLPTGLRV